MRNTPYQQLFDTSIAVKLIQLGARLQVLVTELNISRETLLTLYKEVNNGESPSKGMLPFSVEWFITWQPCVHSSLFMSYYRFFEINSTLSGIELLIKSYEMYLEEISRHRNYDKENPVLSITRAWIMLKMVNVKHPLLKLTTCKSCGGGFVTGCEESTMYYKNYHCGFCNKPARAGKTERNGYF